MRAPAAPISPAPGDILAGQYRVEGVLGAGGMGTVYAVVDTASGARLAMKVVDDTSDEEHVTRFFREGRATVRIESEHVVRVHDLGSIDGRLPYMVMERLVGTTLKAMLRDEGPLDDRTVADLAIQACEGLAHAHAHGIIHRDIKPSNLFVLDELGGAPRLKILDFGISKVASLEDWERTTTESGAFLGSPYYVSPEQLRNPSRIDPRADVWSLGVTMYNALSGKHPFEGGSLAELLVAVMSGEPTPLAARSRAGRAMQGIVARCIDRDVDRRFRDMGELAGALAPLASPRWSALAPRIVSVAARAALERATPPPVTRDDERTATFDEPPVPRHAARTMTLVEPPLPRQPTGATGAVTERAAPSTTGPPQTPAQAQRRPIGIALMLVTALAMVGGAAAFAASRSGSAPTAGAATSAPADDPPGAAISAPAPHLAEPRAPAEPTATGQASEQGEPTATGQASEQGEAAVKGAANEQGETRELTLELTADAPITKVIRPAARRVALEDGKAKVTVTELRGEQPIDVELAGGRRAHGVAREGGPLAIKLTTTRGSVARPHPTSPKTAPRASKELQESPYE